MALKEVHNPKKTDTLEKQRKLAFREINIKLRSAYGTPAVIVETFRDGKHYSINLLFELRTIMPLIDQNWADFSALKGKTIMDIGCGAKAANVPYYGFGYSGTLGNEHRPDYFGIKGSSIHYEPWLCRALNIIGADVTGLDVFPNYDSFKSYCFNIVTSDIASLFPKESFDIIHTSMLLPPRTSPMLNQSAAQYLDELRGNMAEFVKLISKFYDMGSYNAMVLTDPGRKYVNVSDYSKLISGFIDHISKSVKVAVTELLTEGGLFISEGECFEKKDGALVTRKS